MKKLYTLVAAVLLTAVSFAQSPEKMSYQAVIRDSGDALVANQAVGMQISILQGSIAGASVYTETQSPTTNINGLVSFEIGNGMIVSGTFASIDWSAGPYFIKTETDPTGGISYSITGTSKLLSVPFALYSANTAGLELKADKASPTLTGDVVFDTNGVSFSGGNVAFDNGQTFVRSAQVFNSAENFFYGPSVEFNTATNFATGTLNILNSAQAIGNVLTDVNGDGVATWQAPVTSTIADGSITEAKLAFDTATQTELNLKADIDSPTFIGNVGIGADLNIVGNMFADGGLFLNSWDVYANPGIFSINESGVAPHFNIIPGGNVGIGTVSPDYIMDIEGTGGPRARIYSNDNFYAGLLTQNATHQYFVGTQGTFEAAGGTNSGFHIYDNTVGAQRLVIDANGNIGINNFAPAAKLDVVGTVKIVDGTEGNGKVLTSDAAGNATWQAPVAAAIADGSITEVKLSASINTSLDLADSAVQQATITTLQMQIAALDARLTALEPNAILGEFRAGGVVFYIDGSGKHGLVCAVTDQSLGSNWGTAISSSSSYNGGGFTDWYLPSITELSQMYTNRALINDTASINGGTNFSLYLYWSSTDASITDNYNKRMVYFLDGAESINSQYNGGPNGRAVRAF